MSLADDNIILSRGSTGTHYCICEFSLDPWTLSPPKQCNNKTSPACQLP